MPKFEGNSTDNMKLIQWAIFIKRVTTFVNLTQHIDGNFSNGMCHIRFFEIFYKIQIELEIYVLICSGGNGEV